MVTGWTLVVMDNSTYLYLSIPNIPYIPHTLPGMPSVLECLRRLRSSTMESSTGVNQSTLITVNLSFVFWCLCSMCHAFALMSGTMSWPFSNSTATASG